MAFERRILTSYDATTAGFDRGTRRVEQQLARLNRTADDRLGRIDRRFERSARAVRVLGTALAALGVSLGVGAVRRYAEAWRNAGRQLTAAGEAVDGNREKLARLAIRVRGDFDATGGAVARFARVTGDGLDASIRRVETLQKLLAIGGAAPTEAASATLQLTQGLRAGQLGGEELRAIREAAPIEFLDALAARAGGTRAELKQLGADGRLTAEVIKGALDDLARTADQKFAELTISGTEAAEVLGTGFSVFIGRLDENLGATSALNTFLVDTGKFLAEDAEAAATFAKALEITAVAAASLAGARGLGAVNRALVQGAAARNAAVISTQAEVAASQAAVQAARERVVVLGNQFAVTQRNARSSAQLEKSRDRLTAANARLAAAEVRATAATNAHTIAQQRLSLAARASTAAMNTLRGVLAFFGGVPGLILAAVSAAVLLSDAFETQADRLENLRVKLGDVEAGVNKVREVEQNLADDTEALRQANERLEAAIVAQSTAAEDTARLEIDAINRRIAKNQELKAEYESLLRAQLASAEAELAQERPRFLARFGRAGDTEFEEFGFTLEDTEDRRQAVIAARRASIIARQDSGEALSRLDVEFLRLSSELSSLEKLAISTRAALDALGEPVEVRKSGARTRGGAAASATREQKNALDELIASADERVFQLIDEAQLLRATAEEVAFLEEKQRLLNEAMRLGLEPTPELIQEIDQLAASYANAASQVELLRDAREVIADVTERNLTVEQRINRERERLLELLPAIIELVGDEAVAHEILADAIQQATEEIRRDSPLDELSDDIARAISQADSFKDALNRVLEKLFELVAQDFFGQLLSPLGGGTAGGQSSSGLFSSIFGLFSGGFSLFGGGGSTSTFNPTSSSFKPFFHSGGVVGQPGPVRLVPDIVFADAPRMHAGGIAGLGANEVPAILERGEIVVPKGSTLARASASVTVEGSTIVLQGSNATPEELQRILDQRDRRLVDRIIQINERDPGVLHT